MKKSVTDTLRISTVPLPGGIRHCYVSATMSLASAPEMFHRVTEAVSNCNARILSLVAFAPPGTSHMGMRSLEAAFGVPEWPLAWLEHPHGDGPDAVSCQIFALSGAPVRRLESAGRIIGSVYESEFAEFCLMGSLLPSGQSLSRSEQCRRLFETMEAALGGAGMNFHHVVRTWFYLDRILSWYDDFNAVRTAFFTKRGMMPGSYPASTGVGMTNPQGAAILGSALAVRPKGKDFTVKEVDSTLQCAASDYKSSFSRAVEMAMPGCRTLHVSGTASIGRDGGTVHVGDVDGQIELALQAVRDLLLSRGMDWPDVNRAVAYCADLRDVPRLARCLERQGVTELPLAVAHADICRDDLLFEMEVEAATALVPDPPSVAQEAQV